MSVLTLLKPPARPRGRRIQLAVARGLIRTIGRTSTGIRLCFRYGLTSGRVLEDVYRNQPDGSWLIGRWIDRAFLSHPNWQAVRQRRRLLLAELDRVLAQFASVRRHCRLVDLASGPADYVLDLLANHRGQDISAIAIDGDERWVRRGRRAAQRLWLGNIQFRPGDVMDRAAMLAIRPPPNLVIASGFYDWITDEADVARSVSIVSEMLEEEGRFVLTNQVHHYDLELVERCFTNFRRGPCRMKLRSVEQMERALSTAGLVVERTNVEPHGCFSVTVARKPASARAARRPEGAS